MSSFLILTKPRKSQEIIFETIFIPDSLLLGSYYYYRECNKSDNQAAYGLCCGKLSEKYVACKTSLVILKQITYYV